MNPRGLPIGGALTEPFFYFALSVVLVLGTFVGRYLLYRCPHCRRYLDRSYGDFCPYCGERLHS